MTINNRNSLQKNAETVPGTCYNIREKTQQPHMYKTPEEESEADNTPSPEGASKRSPIGAYLPQTRHSSPDPRLQQATDRTAVATFLALDRPQQPFSKRNPSKTRRPYNA